MKRTMIVLSAAALLVAAAILLAHGQLRRSRHGALATATAQTKPPTAPPVEKPFVVAQPQKESRVDIVLALDTSGSMSGLINAARQKLWDIVNQVAQAEPKPRLRIGLVTYGSEGTERDGFVVIRSDLTTDLDGIYAKLFELQTNGGTEYVARTVLRSVKELSWDDDPDTLKQIYVAGNEAATQDRKVSVETAVELAREHDIFVNAIYCGAAHNGEAAGWRAVASAGNGLYAAIDHNHGTVALASPYDDELAALSTRLNSTYVGYGSRGKARRQRQAAQDRNAASLHKSAAASRALAKASGVYANKEWDLVDAVKAKRKVPRAALPQELAGKSDAEVAAFVGEKQAERRKIQQQIHELGKKRKGYLKSEMKRQGKDASKAFDSAVKRALAEQAKTKNIKL